MPTKQEILDEIRRTARANGGKPLGMARFEQETGIKPYVWEQHWARFSDAQHEAGFEANRMQGAYSDAFLVEKLIGLIRKLGKFPTKREIIVGRQNDPYLPPPKAFYRLGGKDHLVQLVLAHCTKNEGLDDIAAFAAHAKKDDGYQSGSTTTDLTLGEVYLFKSGKFYKIGRTNDTVRRGAEIRIQLPEKMTLIHSIRTDDPAGIEAYWHKRFEQKRMNGEWFNLSSADVQAFKRWRRIA